METKILNNDCRGLQEACKILKSGGVVAVPTETVYGLCACAMDVNAVKKVYSAKNRDDKLPVLLIIPDLSYINKLSGQFNQTAKILAAKFWPGPLTLVVNKSREVPKEVSANGDTVALRLTSGKQAQRLMRMSGLCLTSTSANISGGAELADAMEVYDAFRGKIDAVLKRDEIKKHSSEVSTIVDTTSGEAVILRQGAISETDIGNALRQSKSGAVIIGITGPMGVGKSLVCDALRKSGITVIDADRLSREVVEKGSPCLVDLTCAFGRDILNLDGSLNRSKLASIAFSSGENIELLNRITHPYILEVLRNNIDRFSKDGAEVIILDAPTLFQSGANILCNKTVSILAPVGLRMSRIIKRDKLTKEEAIKRIEAGLDDEEYKLNSDFIMYSDCNQSELFNRAKKIIKLCISNEAKGF